MAVHKRSYHGYSGQLTPLWSRCLIVSRYAFRKVFQSRLMTAYFVACFFYPVGCLIAIYLNHNLRVLEFVGVRQGQLFAVDPGFFLQFLRVQSVMAFVVTALVGPGLVSPDLANNALPLYFCRPLSRADYIVGKALVLAFLLSLITWLPGLILFALESALSGAAWMWTNFWMAGGIFLGSMIEILVFSLLALALSAWIRRRLAAGAALLGVFFFGSGFAQAINVVLETKNGFLIDLANLITRVEDNLFRQHTSLGISIASAWAALLVICCFCLMLLARKVRAYEVIKG